MKSIPPFHQFLRALLYTIKKRPLLTILFFVVVVSSVYIAASSEITEWFFTNFFDAFAGITTLLIAAGLAVNNYLKVWRDSRPKTLTVHFTHNGYYYLSCYFADLTSKADIRMWSQQLGQQMTGGAFLDFNPYFDLTPAKLLVLAPNNTIVLHHEINILLKSTKDARSQKELFNGFYKRWYVVHNNEHYPDEKIVFPAISAIQNRPSIYYADVLKYIQTNKQNNNDTVSN